MSKIYGYVIINEKTGEQWGQVYQSLAGAARSYNEVHNGYFARDGKHKFADQSEWVRKPLVLQDE